MALRDQRYREWEFSPQEARLFLGAYTPEFGNIAHKVLLARALGQVVAARKFQRNVLHIRQSDEQFAVRLPHDFVQTIFEELEVDGELYENPDRFKNGEELLHLVDDCKDLMIEEDIKQDL